MFLKRLHIQDFRNLKEVSIDFSEGVNSISGDNAQGKTSLLEAIFFLSTGRSFRTSDLKQLIRKESSGFYLAAEFEKEGVAQSAHLSFNGETKQLQINGSKSAQFAPLMGLLPVVLYAPEDVTLINGAPLLRRRFLNMHIAQADPQYVYHLGRYHRAMRQRNELLRKKSEETIGSWEAAMAHSAAYLMARRKVALEELEPLAAAHMETLSGKKEKLTLSYSPSLTLSSEQALCEQLRKERPRELHLGTTLNGPHRDEIHFLINGQPARSFASIGQRHTLLAALRFAEWERLKGLVAQPPLFCIDDFGIHLDATRQKALQKSLGELGQIFITAPMIEEAHFTVDQGVIRSVSGRHALEENSFHR
jgi:DNA replication and repair protein RecF